MLHGVCLGRVLLQLTVKDSRQVESSEKRLGLSLL